MTLNFELETRKKIYDIIFKNPGLHASKIAELLNIKSQLVDYHLLYLERNDLITIEKKKGYKRCFIKGLISYEDKKILSLLRQEIPLKIVLFLLKYPYSRHKDIVKAFDLSSPRFSYHLKKLVKTGIVIFSASDEKTGYKVKDEKEIIKLLIKYKPTGIAESVMDTWAGFGPG